MREKFLRFMQGRYGMDAFSRFLLSLSCLLIIFSAFRWGRYLYFAGIAVLIYTYYRCLSKNVSRRYAENCRYQAVADNVKQFWNRKRWEMQQKKQYHIFRCPNCNQKIRIPRGRGKIEIDCPICHTKFRKRS